MKTIRFKPEYFEQTAELFRTTVNAVSLPSDIFFDIARLFEDVENNGSSICKLLSRAYTVLATEGENVVGILSMDKDGNIGIFEVKEGETFSKACRLLLNTASRRAEQKELPYLFVFPNDGTKVRFEKFGYAPFDPADEGGAADGHMLAKKIESKAENDFPVEAVKRFTLDPKKRIVVEGMTSPFPYVFFGMACFFNVLLIVFAVNGYDEDPHNYNLFFGVFGAFFVIATGIFIGYFVRGHILKKRVLSMRVTNAVIVSLSRDLVYEHDKKSRGSVAYSNINLSYVFFDDDKQKRKEQFRRRYKFIGPEFFIGQELVVAYSPDKSYVLRRYTIKSEESVASAKD